MHQQMIHSEAKYYKTQLILVSRCLPTIHKISQNFTLNEYLCLHVSNIGNRGV